MVGVALVTEGPSGLPPAEVPALAREGSSGLLAASYRASPALYELVWKCDQALPSPASNWLRALLRLLVGFRSCELLMPRFWTRPRNSSARCALGHSRYSNTLHCPSWLKDYSLLDSPTRACSAS